MVILSVLVPMQGCEDAGSPSPADRERNERFVRLMNTGQGLMGQFDFAGAREAFELAADLRPESLEARLDASIARLNEVDPMAQDEAIAGFAKILEEKPGELRARYCSGLGQLYLGRPARQGPLRAGRRPDRSMRTPPTSSPSPRAAGKLDGLDWYLKAESLDPS